VQPTLRSVGDAGALHQWVEARVLAQVFEHRMDFELQQEAFVLLKRLLQPLEGRILLA
jgi:hypothetical protein